MKKILFRIFHPVLIFLALKKYHGIWGLKEHLRLHPNNFLLRIYESYLAASGSWIGYSSTISGTPCFPHGITGIFISGNAKLGKDVVIFQQVTIGSNMLPDSKHPGSPTIGNQVYIGAGAKIIGGIQIGDGCRIGANAVVYEDMPPYSVAVCAPTRIIQKEHLNNTYRSIGPGGVDMYFQDGSFHMASK